VSKPKSIVLDANILIRAVLGTQVRSLLNGYEDAAEFYTPDICLFDAAGIPHRYRCAKESIRPWLNRF
jgi:predicted nucleic acid-binding protein